MRVFLRTGRLVLREIVDGDADDLFDLDNDPAVMRFLNGGKPVSRESIRADTMPRLTRHYERFGGAAFWAALERRSGRFLGWFALTPEEDEGVAELGYRLRRDAWGHGYATEGSRALLHKGFTELGLRRVVANTMAVNAPSRRVMEKAGLSLVRVYHLHFDDPIPGTEHGEVEYAVDLVDWQRRESSTDRG